MIKIQFEYCANDVRAGTIAITKLSGARGSSVASYVLITAFLVFAAIYESQFTSVAPSNLAPNSSSKQAAAWLWILPVLPWMIVLLFWCYVMFKVVRQREAKGSLSDRTWTLEADSSCFTLSDTVTRVERKWGAFQDFVEQKDHFLLFTAPKLAVIVPKRIFDQTTLTEFSQLVEANVQTKTRAFPVIPLAQQASDADTTKNM